MTVVFIIIGILLLLNIAVFVYLYAKVKKSQEWDEILKNKEIDDDINFA